MKHTKSIYFISGAIPVTLVLGFTGMILNSGQLPTNFENFSEMGSASVPNYIWFNITLSIIGILVIAYGQQIVAMRRYQDQRNLLIKTGFFLTGLFIIFTGIIPWTRYAMWHNFFAYGFGVIYGITMLILSISREKDKRNLDLYFTAISGISILTILTLSFIADFDFMLWQTLTFGIFVTWPYTQIYQDLHL